MGVIIREASKQPYKENEIIRDLFRATDANTDKVPVPLIIVLLRKDREKETPRKCFNR